MTVKSLNKQEKKVVAIATSTAAQALKAGVSTYLNFATIAEDNYGAVSAQTKGPGPGFAILTDWNFKVPKTGVYDIQAQISTAAHTLVSAKKYRLSVFVNGVEVAIINKFQSQSETALFEVFLKGEVSLRLNKNDVVKFAGLTDSAVDVDISTEALANKIVIAKREMKIEEN